MRNFLRYLWVASWLALSLCVAMAFAGDPSPLPSLIPGAAVADSITTWTGVLHALYTSAGFTLVVGFVEIVLRKIPSQKPLSILIAIGKFAHAIGAFFEEIGKAADAVVPQSLKPPGS